MTGKERYQRSIARAKSNPIEYFKIRLRSKISNLVASSGEKLDNIKALDLLSCDIEQIFQCIENQFDNWMSWENWGVFDPKNWKDDDPMTWRWQLDFVERISDMDQSFTISEKIKKLFAIDNLRVIDAKTGTQKRGKVGGDIRAVQFVEHRQSYWDVPSKNKWADYCLTEQQHNILTGLMLGDGHLHRSEPTHNPLLSIERSVKDLEYLKYNKNVFETFCNNDIDIDTTKCGINGYDAEYKMSRFSTRSCPYFSSYYDEWYDETGFKRVPRNLVLNSEIIAIWFADDGNIKTRKNKHRFYLRLCTEGFLPEDVEFLADLLTKRYGEPFSLLDLGIAKDGHKKLRIMACDYAARKMLQDIDTIFPESMQRKSAIWRRPEARFYNDVPLPTNPILKNRLHSSMKEEITLKKIKENSPISAKQLVPLLNQMYNEHNIKPMTDQYGIKYIENLYRRGIIQRIVIPFPAEHRRRGGRSWYYGYFV